MKDKINKNDFFDRVAERGQTETETVKSVYNAIVGEITDIVCAGHNLSLTGFGTFSLKIHRGHPVQFKGKDKIVGDYPILKFTASDVLMSKIRRKNEGGEYDESQNNESEADTIS